MKKVKVKNLIIDILRYLCLAILVAGIAFTVYIILSGIQKSFDATKDDAKATSAPVAYAEADYEV